MIKNYKLFAVALAASTLFSIGCHNTTSTPSVAAPSTFIVTPLTANKASYGAPNIDTNLQDTWGLAFNASAGFPWVANRASGTSTIYDSLGVPKPIVYRVKGPGGAKGSPTGIVQNTSASSFLVQAAGTNASWIFSELNGTIAAVAAGSSGDSTFLVANRSTSASYTGLAMSGTTLFAPNITNGSLDQFGSDFSPTTQVFGKYINQGYAPFNVVAIDTVLYVTSAKMASGFVALGPGNGGYVDVYNLSGNFVRNFSSATQLDEPWGVAIAPSNFGTYSGKLLVGNFGDGKINVLDPTNGNYLGTLNSSSGPIVIPGLWALVVYNGTLYYTAGPNGSDGVFGKITIQ